MTNTDKIVEYTLKNATTLPADKIVGLAQLVRALGGDVERSPNKLPKESNPLFDEETPPMDLSEVEGLVVDGLEKPIKIYQEG